MNSFNALGFLALGSLMNAVPALMPSLVARGLVIGDMTTGAIWLHLMGFIVGMIGSVELVREAVAYHTALRTATVRRSVTVPQPSFASTSESEPAAQAA